MEYLCPACGASEILYQVHLECCPYCGCTKLYFTHLGFENTPTHRVLLDCKTGESLEPDLCDVMRKAKVNHE